MAPATTFDFDNPGKSVISPIKLTHVVLRTRNYNRMTSFYKTFLGGKLVFGNEFFSLITYDDEHHRIGIIGIPHLDAKNPETSGLEHIAFTFSSLQELVMAYLQRKEHGILPFWTINHGPTISLYYKDPDGNMLETQVETFDNLQEATDFMYSDAYKINPIGVDFNIEDLIAGIKAGKDEASLMKRPESGPRGIDSVPA